MMQAAPFSSSEGGVCPPTPPDADPVGSAPRDTNAPWMQSPQADPRPRPRPQAVINYLEYVQKNIGETYVFTV